MRCWIFIIFCRFVSAFGAWAADAGAATAAAAAATAAPTPEAQAPKALTNLQKMMKIQHLINDELRPGLQADGGDLELIDIDGDRVVVQLKGACAGCPGAQTTLKRWVEARLREEVSPSLTVVAG